MSSNQWNEYFNIPNPGLRAYFSHVREGQDEEFRTTFYRGKSVNSILQGWATKLNTLKTKWPSLVEFEDDLRKKVGPMSIMLPLSKRMSDIDSYYDSILLESKPLSDEAVGAVIREWRPVRGLRPRSQTATVNVMKKSTNSGSPYFTKRSTVTNKTVPCEVFENQSTVDQLLPGGNWRACAVLGWRGQEGGPSRDDVKQRVVWMFPYSVNVRELQVYQPLIVGAQHHNIVPAWVSMDAVDARITELFDTKGYNDLIVCTDFSKFDQHFNHHLQEAARTILDHILSGDNVSRDWLYEVFPIKYMIPLAYDWGKIRFGEHGMASGSGGTNADETLVHRALQYEAAISQSQQLNPHSQCLGDDGILSYPGIQVDDVVRSYTAHGLEMNKSKQYASKHDCTYLRRWHHAEYRMNGICVGVYSTYRALGRLAEQERYYDPDIWGPKMVALRQLSIIENCKYHPLREEFVDYCMRGDKFRLGLDIPGFMDNLDSLAKEATEYMPDFLGYTKSLQNEGRDSTSSGISSWWVVNYLKSKA